MSTFGSLTLALEGWFDTPICALPDTLRHRVEQEFFPMSWDKLAADQRRSVALQMDYQRDPVTEQDQTFWWNFFEQVDGIRMRIAEWDVVATPTAAELATKEVRLAELKQELARMEAQQHDARGDYYPERKPSPRKRDKSHADPAPEVPYTKHLPVTTHTTPKTSEKGSTVRRDARKLVTQAMYKEWQKAYRAAVRTRPNMPDTWYAQQIAKSDAGKRRSAETIRKHMKP